MNIEKVKDHFRENRKVYFALGVGIGIGAITVILTKKYQPAIDAYKSIVVVGDKNVVITKLERRGHPGYLVQCIETGEVFASQERASEVLGIDSGALSRHLNGARDSVKDLHFRRLGEAA